MESVGKSTSISNIPAAVGRALKAGYDKIADGCEAVGKEVVDVVTWSDDAKDKAKNDADDK